MMETANGWPHPEPGDRLADTFDLRGVLGAGGMAVVFDAVDRFLGRRVAIKFPTGRVEAERLLDEAKALGVLHVPGLPTVHGLRFEGAAPFLVMEFVRGMSLEEHLDLRRRAGRPYDVPEALEILAGLVEALRAVHDAGLAHLDVKPANVILSGSRAVLVDFGLARPVFSGSSGDSIVGTPAYIAPEIVRGAVPPGGAARADLYELGVTAFELLSGTLPFDGDTVSDVLEQHVNATPPDLLELRPELPVALCGLVDELLAKEPARRPTGMEELQWRLREIAAAHADGGVFEPRVLVVDDDPDMLELVVSWAGDWLPGAQLHVAEDGDDALGAIGEHDFDLAIVDLAIPGVSGIELVMYLRGAPRRTPPEVIVVSGRASDHDRRLLREIGVEHVLAKGPALERELARRVRVVRGEIARRSAPPVP